MGKLSLSAAMAAIALFLSACSGVRVIEIVGTQNYYNGAFEFATQSGSIKTIVLGSPFGKEAGPIDAVTTGYMKGANRGPVVTFEPARWTKPGNAFRVVVVFNGRVPFGHEAICKYGPDIGSDPGLATARMDAAFCQGDYLLSSAEGYVDGLTGPDDPRFGELVKAVTLALIPAIDYHQDGGEPTSNN
jgi:hypothetical protein